MITRRQFGHGIAASTILRPLATKAQPSENDARVAIVDAPVNVSDYVPALQRDGVQVVGRYFARKPQPEVGLPEKRIAFNKSPDGASEASLLHAAGINVLSVYQYYSGSSKKFLYGLDDTGSPKAEAASDADAALDQAGRVKQPQQTAIYFGVDYNCKKGAKGPNEKDEIDFICDYFEIINNTIGDKFVIGAYANGFVNRILRSKKLISLSWVSPSLSYEETTSYIASGDWHLFQNQVDRRWYEGTSCPSGLDVDTNVQKSASTDIGCWGGNPISAERTELIYKQRRVALRDTSIYERPDGKTVITKRRCVQVEKGGTGKDRKKLIWVTKNDNVVPRLHNVRVIGEFGQWIQVDSDDDGKADGFCLTKDFVIGFGQMPPWK